LNCFLFKDKLQREFHATLCHNEHWSQRVLKERDFVADCLIIYPQAVRQDTQTSFDLKGKSINQFVNFYKMTVPIPLIP
jgi:hypothetical protein